jgi:hypothetical protein
MSYKHITDNTATVCAGGRISKAEIQVNAALTGSITVYDAIGSDTTPVVAVITNPTVGSQFKYYDFTTGVKVTASGTCDITVNTDSSYGAK